MHTCCISPFSKAKRCIFRHDHFYLEAINIITINANNKTFRYYFSTLLSLEGKVGYYNSSYKESNWKLEGEKVTGPKMNIKKLPVIQLNIVIGL